MNNKVALRIILLVLFALQWTGLAVADTTSSQVHEYLSFVNSIEERTRAATNELSRKEANLPNEIDNGAMDHERTRAR